MDEYHHDALVHIRDAYPPLTREMFIEAFPMLGRLLLLVFSQHGFIEEGPDRILRITSAGHAALNK